MGWPNINQQLNNYTHNPCNVIFLNWLRYNNAFSFSFTVGRIKGIGRIKEIFWSYRWLRQPKVIRMTLLIIPSILVIHTISKWLIDAPPDIYSTVQSKTALLPVTTPTGVCEFRVSENDCVGPWHRYQIFHKNHSFDRIFSNILRLCRLSILAFEKFSTTPTIRIQIAQVFKILLFCAPEEKV